MNPDAIKTGGPAFPCPMSEQTHSNQNSAPFQGGMYLRDYFAAKALQGMLANQHQYEVNDESMFARDAYVLADAMLAAREAR